MQILVVAATELEIGPFLSQTASPDYLVTGVGVAASVYQLTKHLAGKKYDLVIQAGIAGSMMFPSSLGETIIVEKDVFADAGAMENGELRSLFEMGFADENKWPFENGFLLNRNKLLQTLSLRKVTGITVNTISDNKHLAALYAKKYTADVESMEGAAFHYVCLQEQIDFLQLRALSNTVGERDKANWKMKEAIINLNKELEKIITLVKSSKISE